jgi:RimJ/RimL family protein N-acetyltransferase
VPDLAGDGVRLRPWRDDDLPVLGRGLGDPDIVRWGGGSTALTEDDALRFLNRLRRRATEGSTVAWAVEADGLVAGATGIRSVNRVDLHASVVYWVLPEHRGRGIATAALRVAAAYGLREDGLGLHRLQLQHAIGNDASCRVAQKSGFDLESVQRESFRLHGTFVDEHQHVRLASA